MIQKHHLNRYYSTLCPQLGSGGIYFILSKKLIYFAELAESEHDYQKTFTLTFTIHKVLASGVEYTH